MTDIDPSQYPEHRSFTATYTPRPIRRPLWFWRTVGEIRYQLWTRPTMWLFPQRYSIGYYMKKHAKQDLKFTKKEAKQKCRPT